MSPAEKKEKAPKEVVYSLSRTSRCHSCDRKLEKGEIVKLQTAEQDREALCAKCCGVDTLKLIAKGNARVTRLATKYSPITYIVLQWSEVWKTYERLGILAEAEAVARAEQEAAAEPETKKSVKKKGES